MRYLTRQFALGALRRGKEIEQFLGGCLLRCSLFKNDSAVAHSKGPIDSPSSCPKLNQRL